MTRSCYSGSCLEIKSILCASRLISKFASVEDPRMGHVAWGLLHKTRADIAPNGWDKYVAGGQKGLVLCLSVDADHHEIIQPTHTHLTHEAIEKALNFFLRRDR